MAQRRECRCGVYGGSRLSAAAFLVYHRNCSHSLVPGTICRTADCWLRSDSTEIMRGCFNALPGPRNRPTSLNYNKCARKSQAKRTNQSVFRRSRPACRPIILVDFWHLLLYNCGYTRRWQFAALFEERRVCCQRGCIGLILRQFFPVGGQFCNKYPKNCVTFGGFVTLI